MFLFCVWLRLVLVLFWIDFCFVVWFDFAFYLIFFSFFLFV